MARHEFGRHDGVIKWGWAMLGIGVVVLGIWLVASGDAEQPRCGLGRMNPGDSCSSSKSGPSSYEERQSSAGAVAFWTLRIGLVAALGGAGLVVGEFATRGLRDPHSSRRKARYQRRQATQTALPPIALPPITPEQLIRQIRQTQLPIEQRSLYPQPHVDAFLNQIVAGLEGKEAFPSGMDITVFRLQAHNHMPSRGYDQTAVNALLDHISASLTRVPNPQTDLGLLRARLLGGNQPPG